MVNNDIQRPLSHITLLAVGVENYTFLQPLNGPQKDVNRFQKIFIESDSTSLFSKSQFIRLIDPSSIQLRETINTYIIDRSAENDVLIFYFSGHGCPVGSSDFGFCTRDSRKHDISGSILPMTILKLTDLIETLHVMNVIPLIIIDACYSGIAGNSLIISSNDIMKIVNSNISSLNATNYGVLCACTDNQYAIGDKDGGLFSRLLFSVLSSGLTDKDHIRKPTLNLQDFVNQLQYDVMSSMLSSTPQIFIGDSFPEFPIVKNSQYRPIKYKFHPYLKKILIELWNSGNEVEILPSQLPALVGPGAYGNYNKLSLPGWELIEDTKNSKKIRLTSRGREFIQGKIVIPDTLIYDFSSGQYIPAPEAVLISFSMVS